MMPGAPLLPYSLPSRMRVSYHVSGSSGSMPVKLHTCVQPATMRRPQAALSEQLTSAAVANACSRDTAPLATT